MSHYFENDDTLPLDRKEISFRFLGTMYTFWTTAGIFSRKDLDFGSRVLLETVLESRPRGKALDLGTGYGPVGILLQLHAPDVRVTMSDVNERACAAAQENARRYGVSGRVLCSDGFAMIQEWFDLILFNPPIRAGKKVIYRLFEESRQHLSPGGSLWVVMRKDQGAPSAREELERGYASVSLVKRERGYWVLKADAAAE